MAKLLAIGDKATVKTAEKELIEPSSDEKNQPLKKERLLRKEKT